VCNACSPEICHLHFVSQYSIRSPPHLHMHRCSLHGTVVHFMALWFTAWNRCSLHGTASGLCSNACTHRLCFIDMWSMACRTDMLGKIDNRCTNSERVKMQTIQTQATSKLCKKDLPNRSWCCTVKSKYSECKHVSVNSKLKKTLIWV